MLHPTRSSLPIVLLTWALAVYPVLHAAGCACNGQTFLIAQSIVINVATDTSLAIHGCSFEGSLSITTNPAAVGLMNFAFIVNDTYVAGNVTLALQVGSGTALTFRNSRITESLVFSNVTVENGASVTLDNVTSSRLFWNRGSINGSVDVLKSSFINGTSDHAVHFLSTRTIGSHAIQVWRNNTIKSSFPGTYGLYFESGGFRDGARLELSANQFETANDVNSYGFVVLQTEGQITVDDTNRFLYGGVVISFVDAIQSKHSIALRESYFAAPVGFEVYGTLIDFKLDVTGSTFENGFSIVGSGNFTGSSLNIVSSSLAGGIGFTFRSLHNSSLYISDTVFSSDVALEFGANNSLVLLNEVSGSALNFANYPIVASQITIQFSSLVRIQFYQGEFRGSVLEVKSSGFNCTTMHAAYFDSFPSKDGTVHRWVNNTIGTTQPGSYAINYASSGFLSNSLLILTENILENTYSDGSMSLYAEFDGGTIYYTQSNRIGGVYISATSNMSRAHLSFVNSSFLAGIYILASDWLIDSGISFVGNTVKSSLGLYVTKFLRCTTTIWNQTELADMSFYPNAIEDSVVTVVGNLISSNSITLQLGLALRSRVCYLWNANAGDLTLSGIVAEGSTVSIRNSTIGGIISNTAVFNDSTLIIADCTASSLYVSGQGDNATIDMFWNSFNGTDKVIHFDADLQPGTILRFVNNTIISTTVGATAVFLEGYFLAGSRLEMIGNSISTAASASSNAVVILLAGGTIVIHPSNWVQHGGVSIGFYSMRHNNISISLREFFLAPILVALDSAVTIV
jgi:hypothetical protein